MRAMVVGAGITGACIAWHLADAGVQVHVVEAGDEAGCATTEAGAGFVGQWSRIGSPGWDEPELELQHYGMAFYRQIARTHDIGLRDCGSGFLSISKGTEPWLDGVRDAAEVDASRWVTGPARVRVIPDGIQVDAGAAARAVLELAVEKGATVSFGTRFVLGSEGDADAVVLAAGAWTASLLPVAPTVGAHPVLVTRTDTRVPAPVDLPTLMTRDGGAGWIRERNGGWCYGFVPTGYRPYLDELPQPGQRPHDADLAARARQVPADIAAAIPALADLPEDTPWIQGIPVYTTDHRFIAGPVPGVTGLFACFGCNEAGVTHAPGLGRHLAELVTGAVPTVPAERYALDRVVEVDALPPYAKG